MTRRKSKISVIIPALPGRKPEVALKALEKIDYPPEMIEIFVSYGFSPSKQRNEAVEKARGEILYFLDNDSEIERRAFKRVNAIFSGKIVPVKIPQWRGFSLFPNWLTRLITERFFSGIIYKGEIGTVGGPNIWGQDEPFWASATGTVLESFFAHNKMAARYRPIGSIHRASEKELILCNLAIRRDVFAKIGGFNEALYPNEENELLNRIEKAGYQLIYHPGILVFRPRRETLKSLLKAFFHYGRGRMEQIKIEGINENLLLLIPLVFLFYLLGLIFYHPLFAFFPLVLYFSMAFGSALGFATRRKKFYLTIFLPPLFLIAHLTYASGLLYGLVANYEKKRKKGKVKIVKLKTFGKSCPNLVRQRIKASAKKTR